MNPSQFPPRQRVTTKQRRALRRVEKQVAYRAAKEQARVEALLRSQSSPDSQSQDSSRSRWSGLAESGVGRLVRKVFPWFGAKPAPLNPLTPYTLTK